MSSYKITFTPAEPWFFGNEKSFLFPGQKTNSSYSYSYYIKSELMPSQSTVLGALRYILIPNKKPRNLYTDDDVIENAKYIGAESFDIDAKDVQSFGKIKGVSPIFLIRNKNEILIPAPFNHKALYYLIVDITQKITHSLNKQCVLIELN